MDGPILDAHMGDDALIGVVVGIKNQRAQGGILVALRRRHLLDDLLHHRVDVDAHLGGNAGGLVRRDADHVLNLLPHMLRLGARQVDLVDDRHDLQPCVHGQIRVGQCLRLDALGGVHHQHRALTCGERARYFIVKVHVAGRVDQVEHIILIVLRVIDQCHRMGLDGNAALALQVHVVQDLVFHVAQRDRFRLFQYAVRQRALAVVNVGNDAEIPDPFAWYCQMNHRLLSQKVPYSLTLWRKL